MKELKNFVKKNKSTTIAFICCVIFVILVFVVKLVFFPAEAEAIYGNRLDGIEEVEITKKQQNKITSKLDEKGEVKESSVNIKGRVLNVLITVNDDIDVNTAKGLTSVITDNLDDEAKSFYDIQVFISKDTEDEKFPIIGYKHQDKESFSFTKDR